MFTQKLMEELEKPFQEQQKRLAAAGTYAARAEQIAHILEECTSQEAQALKCLYASMPFSDAVDYPPELFLAYARHGAFLWERGPFAGRIPERLFAGYVLHHRVNNEDLTENREFFYGELIDRIAGMDMRQAILEANYWCASQATYRSTDGRTASPMSVYRCAYGRCGEESTFAVSVLRSLGIPARQVYVPLWSHCDDNHAWVEAWCDGEWVFLGACEPEGILNKGWFLGASSRAMLVHSRWLLPAAEAQDSADTDTVQAAQVLPGEDMCHVMNQIGRYALTTDQEVMVCDRAGEPQADALVRFEVMNDARFGEIASVRTDRDGRCILRTGIGTLHVTAAKEGLYGERLVDTGAGECCRIVLDELPLETENWKVMVISAPKDSLRNPVNQTDEEKRRGRERLQEMNGRRREKESRFYDEALAENVLQGVAPEEKSRFVAIMKKACGNQREIAAFLQKPAEGAFPERWKLAVLESLREKDYRDITAGMLEENCAQTTAWEGIYDDSLLVPYILCPRVQNEMIRPFRGAVLVWLDQESSRCGRNLTEEIRREPAAAWQLVKERLISDRGIEYGNLVTSAAGALESGYGSLLTQRIVCVQILRTLGIPARLNPADGMPEAWTKEARPASSKQPEEPGRTEAEGCFVPLEQTERTCRIIVRGQEGIEWNYFANWTLARFEEDGYHTLMPNWGAQGKTKDSFSVFSGRYRVLTANRLPNGNILAKQLCFELAEGEEKEIRLELAQANLSDMLTEHDIADFALRREDSAECRISELVCEKVGLFIWMGEDEEPTEHILNEIFEQKEAYAGLEAGLYFVAARPQIKGNPAFRRVQEALPGAELLYDDFGADMEALARRLYLEPGKLPLVVLIDQSMTGIYSVAGYNVGTGNMLLKLLNMVKEK